MELIAWQPNHLDIIVTGKVSALALVAGAEQRPLKQRRCGWVYGSGHLERDCEGGTM